MSQYEIPVYPNSKSPKLFKNKFLELLTKTHPIVILLMYFVIGFFLIRYYYLNINPSATSIILAFFTGYFSWTLAEYFMHRFLYHKIGDATFSSGIQYLFHGIHHYYPNDKDRLVLPPVPSLLIAAIFFGVFYLIIGSYAYTFGPGFMIGYVSYMTVHYTIHKVPAPKRFNFWWRHHNIHHYQQHDRAFGVTTSFWDRVFGTMPEPNRKTISVKNMD